MDAQILTLDIDWVADFVLDAVSDRLRDKGVKATWFITHDSPGVRRLMARGDQYEFGLHPNFLPGTTQGSCEREILTGLKTLMPNARMMRTHGLVQSSEILRMAARDFGIEIDVSLLLPGQPHLQPHTLNLNHNGSGLVRLPYFWEDDIEASAAQPSWSLNDARFRMPGLQVYDFHPIHVYLNTERMDRYYQLKVHGPLPNLTRDRIEDHVNRTSVGTGTFFDALLDRIVSQQQQSYTVSEIVDAWRRET